MRSTLILRTLSIAGLFLVALVGLLWLTGALDGLAATLQSAQRAAQDRLAGAIRALRGGEAGALAAFWTVCFGYGVLHAAGPGHGKLVIGGYGVARRVPALRLAGLALVSSLAQAAVAVALVYALVAVLGLTRLAVEGTATRWMTPFSHAMIAGLGLWLIWRGAAGLRRRFAAAVPVYDHGHGHGHVHGPHCDHAHGPTLNEVEAISGWKDALVLVLGIAMRPCSGALFVLILTWQLGIGLAGIGGAFAMGIGTGLVTVGVALLAVWAREGALTGFGSGVARVMPFVELTIGAVIAVAALGLLVQGL